MKNILKWTLGAAVLAGGLGLGATSAQAAQVRVYVRAGDAVYIPPCPGPGYAWVAGYYNDGYWVPGYWNYVGVGYRVYDRDDFRYRTYDRDDFRRYDRDDFRHRDWDRDHERGFNYRDRNYHRGFDRDGHRDRR